MTDAEITRWLAQYVMGWTLSRDGQGRELFWTKESHCIGPWNQWVPLTDPRACAEVMGALRAKGCNAEIVYGDRDVRVILYPSSACYAEARDENFCRAFCLAAVRATGGEM